MPSTNAIMKPTQHDAPSIASDGALPFSARHIGPALKEWDSMASAAGASSLQDLIEKTVPSSIAVEKPLSLPAATTEHEVLLELREMLSKNVVAKSYIGMGYSGTITPPVILRNILENPGWYTQYTPYQAEIAQGRLEALLNFQTLVVELTAMDIANASLLDEGTAAAEAMALAYRLRGSKEKNRFFVSQHCHPQTIAVVSTRAEPLGITINVGDEDRDFTPEGAFGALIQYPTTDGVVKDYAALALRAREGGAVIVAAADLLALTLLKAPGEWGADIVVGNTQRFGVPMGFGGPHAAYLAAKDEFKRQLPGRLVGVSKDAAGNPGFRLALQTREQHIRREKATSNICTAQALLASIASMYAVYHGPEGLKNIASRIHRLTRTLADKLAASGLPSLSSSYFDTLRIPLGQKRQAILDRAAAAHMNLRDFGDGSVGVSLDETVTRDDLNALLSVFTGKQETVTHLEIERTSAGIPSTLARTSAYLQQPVFSSHRSESEMLRYIHKLESRDLALNYSMIPLGSCTMKLNATAEMIPVTWAETGNIHPCAPTSQTEGYSRLIAQLGSFLCEITGLDACSLQPNSGAQGEYAGLLAIRGYFEARGESARDIVLIPQSAHGTNPASAALAGYNVVVVKCEENGNVDVADLRARAEEYQSRFAALMLTYPSTHGVYETGVREICDIAHKFGGQVYMDGANLNAQVGLCRAGEFGVDVCHINLHKTFCIPHGGGGPGAGPICVKNHLAPFLPGDPLAYSPNGAGVGPVSSALNGSASLYVIPWVYIRLMGPQGLREATSVAILNANYVAARLGKYYPVLYRGENGTVAHECILDLRKLRDETGIEVEDVAKRLMDYGFHAPTVSFPVPGTLMVEPTESESKPELDRFCDAMIAIHGEIMSVKDGRLPRDNNPLKNAPHTAQMVTATEWEYPYSRETAAFPAPWLRDNKFWPHVRRIDSVYGDRNLFCTCS
ncbi:MAG: aminomethyl-transferring glycine dehydrogenase [Deltaproteobacteria bacterium]|nr:aminomethyl-transferring glycine dehydrogenase [Deltaproteobacteria bacterium]